MGIFSSCVTSNGKTFYSTGETAAAHHVPSFTDNLFNRLKLFAVKIFFQRLENEQKGISKNMKIDGAENYFGLILSIVQTLHRSSSFALHVTT